MIQYKWSHEGNDKRTQVKKNYNWILPFDRLNPVLELSISFGCNLECSSGCKNYICKILIVGWCQMIQLCMDALVIPEIHTKLLVSFHFLSLSLSLFSIERWIIATIVLCVVPCYLHLLTFLNERCQGRSQVLHHKCWIVTCQVMSRFNSNVVQNEWTDDRINSTYTKLM